MGFLINPDIWSGRLLRILLILASRELINLLCLNFVKSCPSFQTWRGCLHAYLPTGEDSNSSQKPSNFNEVKGV